MIEISTTGMLLLLVFLMPEILLLPFAFVLAVVDVILGTKDKK